MTLWQESMLKPLLKRSSDNIGSGGVLTVSETACPMVNFVKLVKNRLKLFLYGCRYAIFAKNCEVPKVQ